MDKNMLLQTNCAECALDAYVMLLIYCNNCQIKGNRLQQK